MAVAMPWEDGAVHSALSRVIVGVGLLVTSGPGLIGHRHLRTPASVTHVHVNRKESGDTARAGRIALLHSLWHAHWHAGTPALLSARAHSQSTGRYCARRHGAWN